MIDTHSVDEKTSDRPVRVRFAPSPTGYLHIGGVRAALFNWLFAKNQGGKFLLRIEDTDLERSEERYTTDFLSSLKWLGLEWDEDPIYQSNRTEIYQTHIDKLLKSGHAYKCYCSAEEVDAMREKAMAEGKKPRYDRRCRNLDQEKSGPFVVRAKLPETGSVKFHDLIRGDIEVGMDDLDDFVIQRSSGAPTYNLTVVVDDALTEISHVLRGDDHINNTPKQIFLYRFLGFEEPKFAHLPMILGPDKKKLSKRHGASSANVYRSEGYLPEAVINFLARLGWSHGDQEIFTREELIEFFSFDQVQKSSAVFNTEKLIWLNGAHLRSADPVRLRNVVLEDFSHLFDEKVKAKLQGELGVELVKLVQPKVKLVSELANQLVPICQEVLQIQWDQLKWEGKPEKKVAGLNGTKQLQMALSRAFENALETSKGSLQNKKGHPWGDSFSLSEVGVSFEDVEQLIKQKAEELGMKLGEVMKPLRAALVGPNVSASLFELIAILPWGWIDGRLNRFLEEANKSN